MINNLFPVMLQGLLIEGRLTDLWDDRGRMALVQEAYDLTKKTFRDFRTLAEQDPDFVAVEDPEPPQGTSAHPVIEAMPRQIRSGLDPLERPPLVIEAVPNNAIAQEIIARTQVMASMNDTIGLTATLVSLKSAEMQGEAQRLQREDFAKQVEIQAELERISQEAKRNGRLHELPKNTVLFRDPPPPPEPKEGPGGGN